MSNSTFALRSAHPVPNERPRVAFPTPPASPMFRAPRRSHPTERTSRKPRRGDIWFVGSRSLDVDKGAHWSVGTELWSNTFAVVISNDRMNTTSGFAQIVYLSTSARRKPSSMHVPVHIPAAPGDDSAAGSEHDGIAFCEQVHSVDLSRMYSYRGRVPAERMREIEKAILWSLGIRPDGISESDLLPALAAKAA